LLARLEHRANEITGANEAYENKNKNCGKKSKRHFHRMGTRLLKQSGSMVASQDRHQQDRA
jgi:hypothetical protein